MQKQFMKKVFSKDRYQKQCVISAVTFQIYMGTDNRDAFYFWSWTEKK